MSIQFGGLGSGLPVNEWIDKLVATQKEKIKPLETKKEDLGNSSKALDIIKKSFEKFKTSLSVFTDIRPGTDNDLFSKKTVTSSLSEFVTASGAGKAGLGSYSLFVEQLATNTVTKSEGGVGKLLDKDTKFSEIKGMKEGTVSFTFNGVSKTINVGENDTVEDFMNAFKAEFSDVNVSLSNGSLSFETDTANTFSVGLGNDTSNFKNLLRLADVPPETGDTKKTIRSSSPVSITNADASMVSGAAKLNGAVTAGKFKINGEEFEITAETTINELMNKINGNKTAGVSASYDANTNKITFTSTATGSIGINMEDTGNTGIFNTFKINNTAASTTLGKDAIINLNGSKITSTSNTITNTGYEGLTINLLKAPSPTQQINLNIKEDLTELKKATQTFVDDYNTIMKQVQEATRKDGYLEMDSGLRGIYNELRNISSSVTNPTDKVNLLSQIGISTGKPGMLVSDEAVTLKFNAEDFDKACVNNMDSVRKLFVSSGDGVMDKLLKKTSDSLKETDGYFAARGGTFTKQIKLQDEKVSKAYTDLDTYRERLKKQFNSMDAMIAKLNNQYAGFLANTGQS